MSCMYLLVTLLALLPLSTVTTADQDGGATIVHDQALPDRFCMRGRRSKIQTPPSKSAEKYVEKTSQQADAAVQETGVEAENSYQEEEGKVGVKNFKEIRFEEEAADDAKMSEEIKEGANKYHKPAAATFNSPSKAKGSNYYDLENMN